MDNESKEPEPAHSLQETLSRIENAGDGEDSITFGKVLHALGARSFGPLILLTGLIVLAPIIGDIPGVPTIMGIIVIIAAVQQLAGRHHFWLPRRVVNSHLSRAKVRKAVCLLHKPATWIDKVLSRRLTLLTRGPALRLVGAACLLIGLSMPIMELVPFSANLAGLALTCFGLGLIANDGIIISVALAVVAIIFAVLLRAIL